MMLTQDSLGMLSDVDLSSRLAALQHIKNVRESRFADTNEVESDICWLQREIELREIRVIRHSEYLRTRRCS